MENPKRLLTGIKDGNGPGVRTVLLLLCWSVLAGCGGGGDGGAPVGDAGAGDGVTRPDANGVVVIKGNDQMRYSVNEFTVKAGSEVTIRLVNVGKMPKEAMGHNVVVLERGVDAGAFALAAAGARENEYVPGERQDDIIAHTALTGPGETVEVTFTAPSQPGDYEYLCTFPGHFQAGMKGVMAVE